MGQAQAPIGVFDSGVGGLSILQPLRAQLPDEAIVFFADQVHVPYGPRPLDEVQRFSVGITRFLIEQGSKLIVVACNTASAAALQHLRQTFPRMRFVGMEPAVKPAAEQTRTQVVGVLATPATFQGALFASVVERFAKGVRVIPQTLPGLVECIEAGDLDGPQPRRIVKAGVRPLVAQGIDTLVLACTHYPFVIPLIQEVAGTGVQVIDPSPAIARQAARLLAESGQLAPTGTAGTTTFASSGDAAGLASMAQRLIGETGEARRAEWDAGGVGLTLQVGS